ncbi:hypothetical protein EVG20_g537 [Dentipellis fragilis]|uniref:Uncharacterized protein n=1 Tax=Dentipellis fragilis TaxID=205917 RepID=A0A4Y9ZF90_9AGAM|nr:hypothetical protein EVG20_g537 [Dentipellis fragilis]
MDVRAYVRAPAQQLRKKSRDELTSVFRTEPSHRPKPSPYPLARAQSSMEDTFPFYPENAAEWSHGAQAAYSALSRVS